MERPAGFVPCVVHGCQLEGQPPRGLCSLHANALAPRRTSVLHVPAAKSPMPPSPMLPVGSIDNASPSGLQRALSVSTGDDGRFVILIFVHG